MAKLRFYNTVKGRFLPLVRRPGGTSDEQGVLLPLDVQTGPGAGGLQFGGASPIYGPVNHGEYLYVETTGTGPNPPTLGTGVGYLVTDGGYWISIDGTNNPGFNVGVQGTNNSGINLATYDSNQGVLISASRPATGGPGVKISSIGGSGGVELVAFAANTGTTNADITLLNETQGQISIVQAGGGTEGITINNLDGGGITIEDSGGGGIFSHVVGTGNAGISSRVDGTGGNGGWSLGVHDAGNAGFSVLVDGTGNAGFTVGVNSDGNSGISMGTQGTGNAGISIAAGGDGDTRLYTQGTGKVSIQANNTKVLSFFGAAGAAQAAAITAPTGGVVIDVQARAAIVSILSLLSASTGYGLTA